MTPTPEMSLPLDRSETAAVLDYLEHHLPGWPFDPAIDRPFVEELHDDFPDIYVLEQVKLFRWYHDNQTPRGKPRPALRRWVANAHQH